MKISIAWGNRVISPLAKTWIFSILFGLVILLGLFSGQSMKNFPIVSVRQEPMLKTLEGKKIAIIIAFKDFRDEEYFIPKEAFEKKGAEVETVSTKKGTAIGTEGGEVKINMTIGELDVMNFDAIIFIGGPGALKELDNEESYSIIKESLMREKILAAICISPVILAKSGVLSGKEATVWSSALDREAIQILRANDVIYKDQSVVADGNIITADGPQSAKKFAEAISNILDKNSEIE